MAQPAVCGPARSSMPSFAKNQLARDGGNDVVLLMADGVGLIDQARPAIKFQTWRQAPRPTVAQTAEQYVLKARQFAVDRPPFSVTAFATAQT